MILISLALALLGVFWAMGLRALPLPPGLSLHVPRIYLLLRNGIWSVGALFLSIMLFTGRRSAPRAVIFAAAGWLIWRTLDICILQTKTPGWPELALPIVGVLGLIGAMRLSACKAWFQQPLS